MPCFLFFLFLFIFGSFLIFLAFQTFIMWSLCTRSRLQSWKPLHYWLIWSISCLQGVTLFVSFPLGIIQSWSSTVFSLSASVALRVEDCSCALRLNQPPHEARTHEWHVKLVSDQQPGDLLHTSTRTVSQYVSGSVSLCFEPSGAILVTLVVLCMQGPLI